MTRDITHLTSNLSRRSATFDLVVSKADDSGTVDLLSAKPLDKGGDNTGTLVEKNVPDNRLKALAKATWKDDDGNDVTRTTPAVTADEVFNRVDVVLTKRQELEMTLRVVQTIEEEGKPKKQQSKTIGKSSGKGP